MVESLHIEVRRINTFSGKIFFWSHKISSLASWWSIFQKIVIITFFHFWWVFHWILRYSPSTHCFVHNETKCRMHSCSWNGNRGHCLPHCEHFPNSEISATLSQRITVLSAESFRECEQSCLRDPECVQYVFDPPICVTYRDWSSVEAVSGSRGFPLRGICYQSAPPTLAPLPFNQALQLNNNEYCDFVDCLNDILL